MRLPALKYLLDTPPRDVLGRLRFHLVRWGVADRLQQGKGCVFFLSTGRVGSKTMSAVLSLSDKAEAVHEPLPKLFGVSKALYEEANLSHSMLGMQALQALRGKIILDSWSRGRTYFETSPQATFMAKLIAYAYPSAKFVHMVRNPADVIRSGMRRGWYAGQAYDATRITPILGTRAAEAWAEWSVFQKNCWLWSETNQWILDFAAELPSDRYFLLKAEDFFAQDSVALSALCDFCGVGTLSPAKVKDILAKRLNSQERGEFPHYRDWGDDKKLPFSELVGPVASRVGYRIY